MSARIAASVSSRARVVALLALFTLSAGGAGAGEWWKGNLHAHTLWSDGDDYPEMVLDWYKQRGYQFVALSDHNVLPVGPKWVHPLRGSDGFEALDRYWDRFGEWVDAVENSGQVAVRLRTLPELRALLEEPGKFLILQSEEISDQAQGVPIHVNATNLETLIEPQGGATVLETMQRDIDAVLDQRRRTGRPMFPHLNHPNYYWAVSIEDLIALRGERYFEVYNGHPEVHNEGDEKRPSTERLWDLALTARFRGDGEPLFGLAVDDGHYYRSFDSKHANPGRGWVVLWAETLSAEALLGALEGGAFYSSSGVVIESIGADKGRLELRLADEPGVEYRTRFIGARAGGPAGEELDQDRGRRPRYKLRGDELYVRAVVTSSRLKENPYREGEHEQAWTQPVRPGQRVAIGRR